MDPELLMQLLSDPEMADQLAAMGAYGDRMALHGQRARMGESFMQTPSAEGRQVGRAYVASSPLEHASVAAARILGGQMVGDARRAQSSLVQGDMNARKSLAAAMADAMRRSRTQQPAAPGGLDVAGAQFANEYGAGD